MIIEIFGLLGEYRDNIVVVDGWVPDLLPSIKGASHTGSMGVDLALDHRSLEEAGYRTIQQILSGRGYSQGARTPFSYTRRCGEPNAQGATDVELRFLSNENESTSKNPRHQRMPGVMARNARGCDLALAEPVEVTLTGKLPGGEKGSARVRVASIASFLVMKGMALAGRNEAKDAWDIDFCFRHYAAGLDALTEELRPRLRDGLVYEGLQNIADKFASPKHRGPRSVTDFEDIGHSEVEEAMRRDACERINYVLTKLGIEND